MIRRWNKTVHLDSLLGRRVIIIDEAQYLTKDQMGLLLTVLDQNFRCGKAVFIFTSMFDDDEITGARANEWKPLKDRCIVPPLGDVEDADFQNAKNRKPSSKFLQGQNLHVLPGLPFVSQETCDHIARE